MIRMELVFTDLQDVKMRIADSLGQRDVIQGDDMAFFEDDPLKFARIDAGEVMGQYRSNSVRQRDFFQ